MVSSNVDAVNKTMFQFSGRSLASGADKCPLVDFIGTGLDWDVKPSPFRPGETFIVFKFGQVQVLAVRPDNPAYPYDTVEVQVKHSGSMRSGFGFIQNSINQALGKDSGDSDLEDFKGKSWRVKASDYNWGIINGQQATGEVWDFSLANTAGGVTTPVAASVTNPVPDQAPAVIQPTLQPAVVAPTVAVADAPDDDAATKALLGEARALELLDGKTSAQFFPVVTVDDVVRAAGPLFMSIIQMVWLAEKVASGAVTVAEDGVHTVVKG